MLQISISPAAEPDKQTAEKDSVDDESFPWLMTARLDGIMRVQSIGPVPQKYDTPNLSECRACRSSDLQTESVSQAVTSRANPAMFTSQIKRVIRAKGKVMNR